MSRSAGSTLPGAEHTLFRGYGPFVALVALILAMAFLAPTIAPERDVTTRGGAPAEAGELHLPPTSQAGELHLPPTSQATR